MWEFIVSGWLPGTSVRVTFDHSLIAGGALFTLLMVRWVIRRRQLVRAVMQLSQKQPTDSAQLQ